MASEQTDTGFTGPIIGHKFDARVSIYEHIRKVQLFLTQIIGDLNTRLINHDTSKLSSPEIETFNEFQPKLKNSVYGSDEYKGFLREMKPALDHHYAKNSHHPEHYKLAKCSGCGAVFSARVNFCNLCVDANKEYTLSPYIGLNGMNLLDIIEMLADWRAASLQNKNGNILDSIEKNQSRFNYSDEMKQIMINTAIYLCWEVK